MKNVLHSPCAWSLIAALSFATCSAQAAGDVKVGADLFAEHCAECHSLKDGKNKKGPSLFSSAGRKAAAVPDFVYSDAMKASGITWTADKLDAYLTLPKKLVPGGTMKYDGMADPKGRADVIAYLSTVR
jgi:cytochrome c